MVNASHGEMLMQLFLTQIRIKTVSYCSALEMQKLHLNLYLINAHMFFVHQTDDFVLYTCFYLLLAFLYNTRIYVSQTCFFNNILVFLHFTCVSLLTTCFCISHVFPYQTFVSVSFRCKPKDVPWHRDRSSLKQCWHHLLRV